VSQGRTEGSPPSEELPQRRLGSPTEKRGPFHPQKMGFSSEHLEGEKAKAFCYPGKREELVTFSIWEIPLERGIQGPSFLGSNGTSSGRRGVDGEDPVTGLHLPPVVGLRGEREEGDLGRNPPGSHQDVIEICIVKGTG